MEKSYVYIYLTLYPLENKIIFLLGQVKDDM